MKRTRHPFAPQTTYIWCMRCSPEFGMLTSAHDAHHTVLPGGMIPYVLCEECWVELGNAEARLPFYEVWWDRGYYKDFFPGSWEEVVYTVEQESMELPVT